MKILSSQVDSIKVEKNCSAVVRTDKGVEITMYGEIMNGKIDESMTGPSYWNSDIFHNLTDQEQEEIKKEVNKELKRFL